MSDHAVKVNSNITWIQNIGNMEETLGDIFFENFRYIGRFFIIFTPENFPCMLTGYRAWVSSKLMHGNRLVCMGFVTCDHQTHAYFRYNNCLRTSRIHPSDDNTQSSSSAMTVPNTYTNCPSFHIYISSTSTLTHANSRPPFTGMNRFSVLPLIGLI